MVFNSSKCLNLHTHFAKARGSNQSSRLDTRAALSTTLDHHKQHVCPRRSLAYYSQYDKPVFSGKLLPPGSGGEKFPGGIFSGRAGGEYSLRPSRGPIFNRNRSLRSHFCHWRSPGSNGPQSASSHNSHPCPCATLGSNLNLLLPFFPSRYSLASPPRGFVPGAYSGSHSLEKKANLFSLTL